MFLYAVAGLGALAIAIGLVSIVAANWDAIPGRIKIATDLLLVLGCGVVYIRLGSRWPLWARDALLLVVYGLTMGSIALIGQVYQLGGSAREAMAIWSILTAPLMALGSTEFLATIWLFGLQSTCATWLIWLSERPLNADGWALLGASLVPWLLLAIGHSSWLQRLRPAYAWVLVALGWAELVLSASIGAQAFYSNARKEPWDPLWFGFVVALLVVAWLWRHLTPTLGGKVVRWLPITALFLVYVPARVSPGDWDLAAALAFIGLWLLVALSAHRAGMLRLLNLATAVIGVRIVIVYFEVFGSLLSTGLGLVTGGVLTLSLVWLWWRTRREFREERT